jgi:hypothetical protein
MILILKTKKTAKKKRIKILIAQPKKWKKLIHLKKKSILLKEWSTQIKKNKKSFLNLRSYSLVSIFRDSLSKIIFFNILKILMIQK